MPSIILWENWSYPFSVFGLVTTLHSQALMLHEQLANKTSHILLLFDIDHWIGKSLRKILFKLEKGNCTLFNLLKHYMDWKNLVYIYRIIYHQNKEFKRRSNSTSYVYYATFFYTSKLDIISRVYSYYLLSHSNTNPSSPYVDYIKKLIISGTIVPSMKSRV